MKRDMELVRHLLQATEQADDVPFDAGSLASDEFDEAAIVYHVELLQQAGLLSASVSRYISGGGSAIIQRLTWQGHDYLDAVRDDTVWNRTKARIGETVGTASLEVIKAVAISVTKEMMGLQ